MKTRTALMYVLTSTAGMLLAAGCMVGPKYIAPQVPVDANQTFVRAQPAPVSLDANDVVRLDGWWERFADGVTADLVAMALDNNYDLKAAASRVVQARSMFEQARGRALPQVSYNLSRDRSKRSFNLGAGPFGGGRFSVLNETWQQDFSVTYLLDLFGKIRHAERAAMQDMLASQANQQALMNSLIAQVVATRINIATLQRRLAIARANTESRRRTLEIVERRYSQGLVGPVDLRLARENLASSQAVEPSVELQLITAGHTLDILLGRPPGQSDDLPQTLADLPSLEPVPVGLPVALLDRRPDIRAAEHSLRSANEQVGVSIAQLFPDLTLTGVWGRSGDTWEDLWMDETEIYSAIFSLAQPIFRGGQIKAQINAAKARYEELAATYASVILTALREVEDALISERLLQEQLVYARRQLDEAAAAEELSRDRYQRGVESILTVLESERRRRLGHEQVAILMGQIWTARVNLFLALGGDWVLDQDDQNKQDTKHVKG